MFLHVNWFKNIIMDEKKTGVTIAEVFHHKNITIDFINQKFIHDSHKIVLLVFFFACKESFCFLRCTLSIFQQQRSKHLYAFLLIQLVCIFSLVNVMTSMFFLIFVSTLLFKNFLHSVTCAGFLGTETLTELN